MYISVKKIISSILLVLLTLSVFLGCSAQNGAPQPEKRTVTDMTGHEITLDGAPEKIVVIDAASCEIVYALGAGDLIAGRGEYCDYPAEAAEIPQVFSGGNTNVEQIIALKPQLVIMSEMAQELSQIEAIEKAGIPVAQSETHNIKDVYASIEMIGKLLDRSEQADKLVSQMESQFEAIRKKAGGLEDIEKTVYFEVSPLEYGLWTAGSDTFMDEIATMLGLKNIFSDVSGWAEISQEQVINRNPDYIVTVTMYFGEGISPEDEIRSRAGWQTINAIKNGDIYPADTDEISRPGPRLADAAEMLFTLIYGEAASD